MIEPSDLVSESGDGVWRIKLGAPGQLVVNAWLIEGPEGVALVDTGFPDTVNALVEALGSVGLRPEDLAAVVYTHTHADHMGGGVVLGARLACPAFVWEGTTPATHGWHRWAASLEPWPQWVRGLLAPSPVCDEMVRVVSSSPGASAGLVGGDELANLHAVAFGETVDIVGRTFVCLDGRGHDPYHALWFEPASGTLIGGDVVLGVPTPIVPPMLDDIEVYRQTLSRVAVMEGVTRIVPGHGRVHDLPSRAIERAERAQRRYWDQVAVALGAGPFDPADTVAPLLASGHPIARKQSFVMLANTHAVLIELARRGLVTRDDERRWHAADAIPEWTALDVAAT